MTRKWSRRGVRLQPRQRRLLGFEMLEDRRVLSGGLGSLLALAQPVLSSPVAAVVSPATVPLNDLAAEAVAQDSSPAASAGLGNVVGAVLSTPLSPVSAVAPADGTGELGSTVTPLLSTPLSILTPLTSSLDHVVSTVTGTSGLAGITAVVQLDVAVAGVSADVGLQLSDPATAGLGIGLQASVGVGLETAPILAVSTGAHVSVGTRTGLGVGTGVGVGLGGDTGLGVGVGVALGGSTGISVGVGLGGGTGTTEASPGTNPGIGTTVGVGVTVDVGAQTTLVPDTGGSVTVTVPATPLSQAPLPGTGTGASHSGGQGSLSADPGSSSEGARPAVQVGASTALSASLIQHVDATFVASTAGSVVQSAPKAADGSLIPEVRTAEPTVVEDAPQFVALHEPAANDAALARLLALAPVSDLLTADGNADFTPLTEMRSGDGLSVAAPDRAGVATVTEGADIGSDPGTLVLEPGAGLVESSPIDLAALNQAVQQFLGQLADLRQEFGSVLLALGPYPWLVALALAGVAYELQRRRQRRAQAELILAAACEGAAAPWFPGLAGLTTLD